MLETTSTPLPCPIQKRRTVLYKATWYHYDNVRSRDESWKKAEEISLSGVAQSVLIVVTTDGPTGGAIHAWAQGNAKLIKK
jgi:hypothetical protein